MAVMYLGQIMEIGSKNDIFSSSLHPYTLLLLNSIPHPDPRKKKKRVLPKGEIPGPIDPPQG